MSTNNLYYDAAPNLNFWLLFKKRFLNAFDMKQRININNKML